MPLPLSYIYIHFSSLFVYPHMHHSHLSSSALVCSPGAQSLIPAPSFMPLPVFHISLTFSCFSVQTEWSRHTPSPPRNTTPPHISHQHEPCMYVQVSIPFMCTQVYVHLPWPVESLSSCPPHPDPLSLCVCMYCTCHALTHPTAHSLVSSGTGRMTRCL